MRLPAPEEVVDDQCEVVGDDDLLEQAPEDQVPAVVELLQVEPPSARRPAATTTSAA